MHDLSPLVLPDEAEGEEDVQPEVGLVLVLEVALEPGLVPRLEGDHSPAQEAHHCALSLHGYANCFQRAFDSIELTCQTEILIF